MRAEMPPLPDRLRLIAWCSAPGLAAAVGDFRAWPARWVCLGVIVGVFLIALLRTTREKPTGKPTEKSHAREAVGVVLVVAALVFAFACLNAARLTVLDLAGRPAVAYVGDMHAEQVPIRGSRERIDYCYDLNWPDGSPVTGRICRDTREYSEGAALGVLAEPTGLIAPETPAEVAGVTLTRNIGLGALALICLAALLGGGLAPAERPVVPPGRYPAWRRLPPQPERRHRPRRQPRKGRRR